MSTGKFSPSKEPILSVFFFFFFLVYNCLTCLVQETLKHIILVLYTMKKHSVADRVSQQIGEFLSNRPHHHTLFCGLTRFCPHCCCSSINSSDSVLPLDGPKVEILFLKTFQLINVCTYVYYIYPIDVDLQERLLDSIVMLAVSKMGTLSNSLATNAVVDM